MDSTSDFGSFSQGSNPCGGTNIKPGFYKRFCASTSILTFISFLFIWSI